MLINMILPGAVSLARLPAEYQEVEYIKSSGTQWINTGVAFTSSNYNKLKLALDVAFDNKSGVYEVNGTGTSGSNCFYVGNYNGELVYGDGKTDKTTSTVISGRIACAIDAFNKVVSVSGSNDIAFTPQSPTTSLNLTIFGFNRTNGTVTAFGETLYASQIYESDNLIRDFVPCYRKSDNLAGLFDLVESKFYSNAGTGLFLAGSPVNNKPIKPVEFTYTGNYTDNTAYTRTLRLNTSGLLTIENRLHASVTIVGAGGGGAYSQSYSNRRYGGGGGGIQTIEVTLEPGTYEIVIGVGGDGASGYELGFAGTAGGDTTAFGKTSTGGGGGKAISSSNCGVGAGGSPNGNAGTTSAGGSPNGGDPGVAGGDGYVELIFI